MKVAYKNSQAPVNAKKLPFLEWLSEAKHLEEKDPDAAIKEYDRIRKSHPLKEESYDRLMILYRKSRRYPEEIRLIKEAIKIFKAGLPVKKVHAKISRISKFLLKSTGLTDKKGQALYQVQPIGRWQKRKQLLEAKLDKMKQQ